MLQEDPVLFQLYKDLVVSQVISAEEFWANRLGGVNNTDQALYNNNKQEVGISGAFLVSSSSKHGQTFMPYINTSGYFNLQQQLVELIS